MPVRITGRLSLRMSSKSAVLVIVLRGTDMAAKDPVMEVWSVGLHDTGIVIVSLVDRALCGAGVQSAGARRCH